MNGQQCIDHYSTEELHDLDQSLHIFLPGDDDQLPLTYESVRSRLQYDQMVDESCAVCELVRPRSSLEDMVLDAALLLKLQKFLRITPSMELSDFIIGQYDASSLDARLAGLLLYPPQFGMMTSLTQLYFASAMIVFIIYIIMVVTNHRRCRLQTAMR